MVQSESIGGIVGRGLFHLRRSEDITLRDINQFAARSGPWRATHPPALCGALLSALRCSTDPLLFIIPEAVIHPVLPLNSLCVTARYYLKDKLKPILDFSPRGADYPETIITSRCHLLTNRHSEFGRPLSTPIGEFGLRRHPTDASSLLIQQ